MRHASNLRRRMWVAALGGTLLSAHLRAQALDAPLRILVAYPPGGVSDAVARDLAVRLSQQMRVPVQVENRPGAGGALAVEALARSRPDGRVLVFAAAAAVVLSAAANARSGAASVLPVAGVMRTPVLVVGTPALQAQSFADMLQAARARPGAIRWATTGEGTTGHAVLVRVQQASGAMLIHVPYKGGAQQLNDAFAGQFEVLSTNVAPQQLQAVRAGRLHALAVGAPARLAVLPEVPTLAELGHAAANLDSLFGLFAPPGTPPSHVQRLHDEVAQALGSGTLRERLIGSGNTPFEGSIADFAEQVAREARR